MRVLSGTARAMALLLLAGAAPLWAREAERLSSRAEAHMNMGQVHDRNARLASEDGNEEEAAREWRMARGDYGVALELWQEALTERPRSLDLRIRIGTALTLLERYREAEDVFRENLSLEPNNPMTLYHLGALYMHEDRFEDARKYLHLLLEVAPWYPDANYLLGYMLEQEGKYAEAAAKYVAERKVNPPSHNAAYGLMKLQKEGKFGRNWDQQVEWTPEKIAGIALTLVGGIGVYAYSKWKKETAPSDLFAEDGGEEEGASNPLE